MYNRTKKIPFALALGILTLQCAEPGPQEPPPPAWYWHAGPTAADLFDIASTARNDVWVVGADAAGAGKIYHYIGFGWETPHLPAVTIGPLYAVDCLPDGDAWAAGGGDYILYWNGTTWQDWPHPAPGKNIYGLALFDEQFGWAVGEGGLIVKFDGTNWTQETSPVAEDLRRVQILSRTSAWAVGVKGTILHYDGTTWEKVPFGPQIDLYDLYFFTDEDGWVVGDVASVYRWRGEAFEKYAVPHAALGDNLRCCSFINEDKGWAGGDKMHMLRYVSADDKWVLEDYLPSGVWDLTAIHFVSDTEGWAVGHGGFMLHYY